MAKTSPRKLAYAKAYREKHRERLNAYFRARKVERNARRRAWNEANRDRQREANEAHHLKRYHDLTVAEYRAMVEAQAGKCAICHEPPSGKAHCGKLHVDHDHETGAIRALLCGDCNLGLGKFRDSPALLTKAAMYLARYASNSRTA